MWIVICWKFGKMVIHCTKSQLERLKSSLKLGYKNTSMLLKVLDHHGTALLKYTDQFLVEMFHNYAFKVCISVENLKLWLLILTKTFLMTILVKLIFGNIFMKAKKSTRAAPLSQNSWCIFHMQIPPLLWRPQGPQACLEKWNHPLLFCRVPQIFLALLVLKRL